MKDLNSVILIGRLTRDAELKYTAGGLAITSFAVAVNRSVKNGDKWTEAASFFDCQIWGKTGEAINKYMIKGKQIAVMGELEQQRWEKEGQNRSKIVINARDVQLLGGQKQEQQESGGYKDVSEYVDDVPF